ncbi:MAG: hypothetical protein HOV80_34085 [Polyangiaceae bacterium]|nr:hypothetical protein [Polyangiaceae bacterium]
MRAIRASSMVLSVGLCCTLSARARAQSDEPSPTARGPAVPAPSNAFELGINAAYTQPFGLVWDDTDISSIINAGGGVTLDLGYRAIPSFSISAAVHFHESTADTSIGVANDFRGGAATLHATYHFLPYEVVDPWVSLGSGYRLLWSIFRGADNDHFTHGVQAVRVLAGIDFRTTRDAAIGPFIGGDVNVMLFDQVQGGDTTRISPAVNTFVTAGAMGRFDIGGSRTVPGATVTKRHASAD